MTACIVLAAGASTRLGQPKQQVFVGERTLLQMAAKAALDAGCSPVVVVLGAFMADIAPDLAAFPVTVVENTFWQQGMASSIAAGLAQALAIAPELEAVLITVCDQPAADASLLQGLVACWEAGGKSLAACQYGEAVGVPAIFSAAFFPELMELRGHEGARKLLERHAACVSVLPFPEGNFDIDTAEDLLRLYRQPPAS